MPTRELLAPSQRVQFTDFTAPLDDRTLTRFCTLSDSDLELIRRRNRRAKPHAVLPTYLLACIHCKPQAHVMNGKFPCTKRCVVLEAQAVADLAMQAVGGTSYFRRSPLERAYRDVRASRDVRAGSFHPLAPDKTLLYAGRLALGQPADQVL